MGKLLGEVLGPVLEIVEDLGIPGVSMLAGLINNSSEAELIVNPDVPKEVRKLLNKIVSLAPNMSVDKPEYGFSLGPDTDAKLLKKKSISFKKKEII